MSDAPDVVAIFAALHAVTVDYVVIGGLAVQAYGRRTHTKDLDVTASWQQPNLERLATAPGEMAKGAYRCDRAAQRTGGVTLSPDATIASTNAAASRRECRGVRAPRRWASASRTSACHAEPNVPTAYAPACSLDAIVPVASV